MDITDYRKKIDEADEQIIKGFTQRMEISAEIAKYKKENGLKVYDPERERKKLYDVTGKLPESMRPYGASLYSLLFDMSKSYQNMIIKESDVLAAKIESAIADTQRSFPERAIVCCQGVEGAYSQMAACRLFRVPDIRYVDTFEDVFRSIEQGLCEYGIVPIENSTAGSVNMVYDLMMKYNFSIVKSVRVKVDHCLLANKGARLSDIKEVISHEQAINQSRKFLSSLKGIKVRAVANTALAAQLVAESGRRDLACLSSHSCESLYGLSCLEEAVQDQGNNYTRFICISKNLQIFPGSNKTSLMMILPHHPGSLYKVLGKFYGLGLNLTKLESRPLPARNFEFMFYFDLENSVYAPEFSGLMSELQDICEEFVYLGSYSEEI